MTVTTQSSRSDFYGTGSSGPFIIDWEFFATEELEIVFLHYTDPSARPQLLRLNVDYTLFIQPDIKGGQLNTVLPVNVGYKLIVTRNVPLTQGLTYPEEGAFSSTLHEQALDRLTFIDQQQQRSIQRALKVPFTNTDVHSTDIRGLAALRLIRMNAQADGFEGVTARDALLDQSGGAINITIPTLNHGFTQNQILAQTAMGLSPALASATGNGEVAGIVTKVISKDQYVLTTTGQITGLTGLIPGQVYYLSDTTPGALTLVEPTTVNSLSLPLLLASSSTTGYFRNVRGKIVPESSIEGGHNVTLQVTQANTFAVGDVVYFDDQQKIYLPACANAQNTSEVCGLVGAIAGDGTSFTLVLMGYVEGLSGLTLGTLFLSDVTPGLMTATQPIAIGSISKPLFYSTSSSTGFFTIQRGAVIPNPVINSFTPNPTAVTDDHVAVPNSFIKTYSSNTGPIKITLPTDFPEDDAIEVVDANGLGWAIIQADGQQCFSAGDPLPYNTTLGSTGQVVSNNTQYAVVKVTCVSQGQKFIVSGAMGNIGFI